MIKILITSNNKFSDQENWTKFRNFSLCGFGNLKWWANNIEQKPYLGHKRFDKKW
jgi:hypothetical protein